MRRSGPGGGARPWPPRSRAPRSRPPAAPARSIDRETRPIEAVVFDMDGVLLDSEPIWRAVEVQVFGSVGVDLREEDLLRTMGVRIADVVRRWHERHPWDDPPVEEVAAEIVERVATTIERESSLTGGAVEAIDRLRAHGLRLALASSSPIRLIEAVLRMGGLEDRFDVVLTGEDEVHGKPAPDVYLSAARALGVTPERCLAIEDSINGVRAAKAAGMVVLAVPPPQTRGGDVGGADLILGSLEELDDRIWEATGTAPRPSNRAPVTIGAVELRDALGRCARTGHARIAGAIGPASLRRLRGELDAGPFRRFRESFGAVRQQIDGYDVPIPSEIFPALTTLCEALETLVHRHGRGIRGLATWHPNEVGIARYAPGSIGITPHLDGRWYRRLVAVATVFGRARFAICGSRDPGDVVDEWISAPGDLVLLRGPGLGGRRDGRPYHLVEGPRGGERVSIGIRMSVGRPAG
ncbi:MAG TPA: hexitol phosphatase HxpB [Actinomycetota bacterium]|nr:hexitol phosphatase HxpB [Actinomycetota bacterium]